MYYPGRVGKPQKKRTNSKTQRPASVSFNTICTKNNTHIHVTPPNLPSQQKAHPISLSYNPASVTNKLSEFLAEYKQSSNNQQFKSKKTSPIFGFNPKNLEQFERQEDKQYLTKFQNTYAEQTINSYLQSTLNPHERSKNGHKLQAQKQQAKNHIENHLTRQNQNLREHRDFLVEEVKRIQKKIHQYKSQLKTCHQEIERLKGQNQLYRRQYFETQDLVFRGIQVGLTKSHQVPEYSNQVTLKQQAQILPLDNNNKQSSQRIKPSIQLPEFNLMEHVKEILTEKNNTPTLARIENLQEHTFRDNSNQEKRGSYFPNQKGKKVLQSTSPASRQPLDQSNSLQFSPISKGNTRGNFFTWRDNREFYQSQNESNLLSPKNTILEIQNVNQRSKTNNFQIKAQSNADSKNKCVEIAKKIKQIRDSLDSRNLSQTNENNFGRINIIPHRGPQNQKNGLISKNRQPMNQLSKPSHFRNESSITLNRASEALLLGKSNKSNSVSNSFFSRTGQSFQDRILDYLPSENLYEETMHFGTSN